MDNWFSLGKSSCLAALTMWTPTGWLSATSSTASWSTTRRCSRDSPRSTPTGTRSSRTSSSTRGKSRDPWVIVSFPSHTLQYFLSGNLVIEAYAYLYLCNVNANIHTRRIHKCCLDHSTWKICENILNSESCFSKNTFDQIHINCASIYSWLLIFFNYERIFFKYSYIFFIHKHRIPRSRLNIALARQLSA